MTVKEFKEILSHVVNDDAKVQFLAEGGYVINITDAFYEEDDNAFVLFHT